MDVIQLVLEVLKKYGLYANLKKYQFHKNKVRFLGYILLAQGIQIKDKRIKVIKNWPKLKLICDN